MTNDEIREKALAHGFKRKLQPDGSMDLSPYVFNAIRACQPQWISVDERLPEEDGTYLVVVKNRASHIDTDRFYVDDSSWEFFNNSRLPKITHWMQLPEPPKGD